MLASKLGDVTLQMFRADLMEGSLMGALQHRPEGFDAIGVRHAVNVLGDRVLDAFMRVGDALVSRCVVGVNHGVRLGILGHKVLQGILVGVLDYAGVDLVRRPVFRANHRRHVHRATPGGFSPLGVRLVFALSAEITFVKLDRTIERAFAFPAPGFPNALHHEPRRRLRNADVTLQFHGRNRLERGQAQVNGNRPFPHRDFRRLHGGSRLHREVGPAIGAPIGHILVRGFAGTDRAAFGAMAAVRPNHRLEPFGRGFLSREHVHQLDDG